MMFLSLKGFRAEIRLLQRRKLLNADCAVGVRAMLVESVLAEKVFCLRRSAINFSIGKIVWVAE